MDYPPPNTPEKMVLVNSLSVNITESLIFVLVWFGDRISLYISA